MGEEWGAYRILVGKPDGKRPLGRPRRRCFLFTLFIIKQICPASFRETCQWLKFPLNGLRAQRRVRPVVGLLPLASGPACLGMAFPPFLLEYKRSWMQHVNRMPRNRLPRVTKYYSPTGRRNHGRPLKRLLDT